MRFEEAGGTQTTDVPLKSIAQIALSLDQRQVMWPNAIVEYALIELNRKVSSEKISFMNKEYNIEERFIAMKKDMKLYF